MCVGAWTDAEVEHFVAQLSSAQSGASGHKTNTHTLDQFLASTPSSEVKTKLCAGHVVNIIGKFDDASKSIDALQMISKSSRMPLHTPKQEVALLGLFGVDTEKLDVLKLLRGSQTMQAHNPAEAVSLATPRCSIVMHEWWMRRAFVCFAGRAPHGDTAGPLVRAAKLTTVSKNA